MFVFSSFFKPEKNGLYSALSVVFSDFGVLFDPLNTELEAILCINPSFSSLTTATFSISSS